MKINKRAVLFLLITNVILIAFGIIKFLYLNETVFNGGATQVMPMPSQLSYLLFIIIPGALTMIILIGLFWIIRVFKERKWILSGPIVFFSSKIISIIFIPVYVLLHKQNDNFINIGKFFYYLGEFCVAYMFFTFLFVKHSAIRYFFLCYALVTFTTKTIGYLGPTLYKEFGYRWLLINTDITFYISFLPTLILFVEIYSLSRRSKNGVLSFS